MTTYVHQSNDLVVAHSYNQQMATTDEYTDHFHPLYEMFYFIDGDIEYIVENRRYELRPHDLLLIRPGEHHYFRIRSEKQYERMVVFFSDQMIPDAIAPILKEKGSLYSVGDTVVAEVFRRMDSHAGKYSGDALALLMESSLTELLVKFACLDREAVQPQQTHSGIDAVAEYISQNIEKPLNIDDICRQFGMSRSYLFKAFTESYHEPPKQYIIRKKIMIAQQLIASGERPISVSERCGFSDYSTFYRAYMRVIGAPPSGRARS